MLLLVLVRVQRPTINADIGRGDKAARVHSAPLGVECHLKRVRAPIGVVNHQNSNPWVFWITVFRRVGAGWDRWVLGRPCGCSSREDCARWSVDDGCDEGGSTEGESRSGVAERDGRVGVGTPLNIGAGWCINVILQKHLTTTVEESNPSFDSAETGISQTHTPCEVTLTCCCKPS